MLTKGLGLIDGSKRGESSLLENRGTEIELMNRKMNR